MAGFEELIEETDSGIAMYIRVQSAAGKSRVLGRHGDAVKISVAAAPVGGRANRALLQFLGKTLGVGESRVRIVVGHSARKKRVEVEGTDKATAAKLLEAAVRMRGAPRK